MSEHNWQYPFSYHTVIIGQEERVLPDFHQLFVRLPTSATIFPKLK
jgi:hypothetical protein